MRPDELARFICGDFEKISSKDEKDGFAGIIIAKNFLDGKNIDEHYFSKSTKIPLEYFGRALERLDRSGLFLHYSWFCNNAGSLKKDPARNHDCMIDWCYVAAKASGFII